MTEAKIDYQAGFRYTENDLYFIALIRKGYTLKQIAALMGVTVRTVVARSKRLRELTGARSLAHLVALTMRENLQSD